MNYSNLVMVKIGEHYIYASVVKSPQLISGVLKGDLKKYWGQPVYMIMRNINRDTTGEYYIYQIIFDANARLDEEYIAIKCETEYKWRLKLGLKI